MNVGQKTASRSNSQKQLISTTKDFIFLIQKCPTFNQQVWKKLVNLLKAEKEGIDPLSKLR